MCRLYLNESVNAAQVLFWIATAFGLAMTQARCTYAKNLRHSQ